MLSPSSLPFLFPQAPYLSALCLHTTNFLSVSASLHHPCPWTYHTGCRTFLFLFAAGVCQSLLQRGFHCLCVTGQQSQSHCHTPIFLTVLSSPYPAHPESQDPLITDITYLLEHSCEPLPSLSSFFSQDPIFQFNSSCFHRLCLFQCD